MKAKKIDIVDTTYELAKCLREDPSMIEKDLLKEGEALLGLFEDETKRNSFKEFGKMKIEVIKMTIEDLSTGGNALLTSTFGLVYKEGKIQTFVMPLGSQPSGDVIYSLSMKNKAAFKNYRDGEEIEISQDKLNAAIFRMAVLWSQLLK
jgi:hypothetical protein